MKKIKVLFILPSLCAGGAERVMSVVARNLNKDDFDTKILILYSRTKKDYEVADVPTFFLNKKRSLTAIPGLIKFINKRKPDIVLTSIGQLNTLGGFLNLFYKNTYFIGREASVKSDRNKFVDNQNRLLFFISRFAYRRLSTIICISQDSVNDFVQNEGIPSTNISLIGNPIHFCEEEHYYKEKKNKIPKLITVGRLTKVKGIDRLLEVVAKLDFDFHYTIIGDGEDLAFLNKRIAQLNLSRKVTHIRHTNQVKEHLRESDLFLQGSYVEGFGMALLESLAVGVPAVIFDAPGGSREMLLEDINGFKVNTVCEFHKKIHKALFDKKWNRSDIIRSVTSKYNVETIVMQYEGLFKRIKNG